MRRPTFWLVLLAGCEARISDAPADARVDVQDARMIDAALLDASLDAPVQLGAWGAPEKILQAATGAAEDDVTLSSNTLELFFAIGSSTKDLYYTSRSSPTAAWMPVAKLPFNTTASDETPRLSADDLTLYFASDRDSELLDIYRVTRPAPGSSQWSAPALVTEVNTDLLDKWYMPCGRNYYVMVQGVSGNGTDLVEGTLDGRAPIAIAALNTPDNETAAFLTADCLTLYFASDRMNDTLALYRSQRAALDAPWPAPTPIVDFVLPGTGGQEDPWLSADRRTFVFASDADGDRDVYISTR